MKNSNTAHSHPVEIDFCNNGQYSHGLHHVQCILVQVQGHMECISLHYEVRRDYRFMERMGA